METFVSLVLHYLLSAPSRQKPDFFLTRPRTPIAGGAPPPPTYHNARMRFMSRAVQTSPAGIGTLSAPLITRCIILATDAAAHVNPSLIDRGRSLRSSGMREFVLTRMGEEQLLAYKSRQGS